MGFAEEGSYSAEFRTPNATSLKRPIPTYGLKVHWKRGCHCER